MKTAVAAFVKALYVAVPQPDRQRSPGPARGNMPACYCVKVRVCRLHSSSQLRVRVKASYLPVKRRSKLVAYKEKLSGSLFGKQGDYEWGEDLDYSIDRLIADLQSHL